jgi:uncharacterized protein YbaA (DUF1428 family)
MAYVDGFVVPVPRKNLAAYKRLAAEAGKVWIDHGALEYRECVGEDLDVKMGRPFPKQLRLKRGETVCFSWIVYSSRAHRDRVNAKVMKDPRMASMPPAMPFDVKRMLYGGFSVLVELAARAAKGRSSRKAPARSRRAAAPAPHDGHAMMTEEQPAM